MRHDNVGFGDGKAAHTTCLRCGGRLLSGSARHGDGTCLRERATLTCMSCGAWEFRPVSAPAFSARS